MAQLATDENPGRSSPLAEVPARDVRADIQGLRAAAVLLVLLFHFWPQYLPGGFIGVDVFFVISGFLITSHLLRNPPHSFGTFAEFWARRLRRLLPASLLVIAVTVIVGYFVLPVTQLHNLGRDALSSALYVENWTLAITSVDYLNAGVAPSPLQHYWSLGVEEQFYLVWPFLVGALAWLAARRSRGTAVTALVGLGGFVLASFIVCVAWTFVQPASAYFATPTRLWELGAGGIVAAVGGLASVRGLRPPAWVRIAAAWVGMILVLGSSLVLSGASPFPGYLALLPVVGACLVIAASAPPGGLSTTRIFAWRPIQFVGDNSYSIYLWHFPMIVLATAALKTEPNLVGKLAIIVACLLLANFTRILVEDPVRRAAWLRAPRWRTYLLAGCSTALVVLVTFAPGLRVAVIEAQEAQVRDQVQSDNAGCLGAQALAVTGCDLRGIGIEPSPALASQDVSDAYPDGCFAQNPYPKTVTCEYGDEKSPEFRVALVGNSHGGQWLPALQALQGKLHFSITTFVASSCMPTTSRLLFDTAAATDGCLRWGQDVVKQTSSGKFDLVVASIASNVDVDGAAGDDQYTRKVQGYQPVLEAWATAGQKVLLIRDTPFPGFNIPDCVAVHLSDLSACDGPRATWVTPDPFVGAAQALGSPLVRVVDLNDGLCGPSTCYSVVGGVIVYFDAGHVDATYVRSMAAALEPSVAELLAH